MGWEKAMKIAFEILLLVVLLLLFQMSEVCANDFALLESYPAQGQIVKASDLVNNPIYLKFNHPVDRSYIGLVKLVDKTANSICQLNICGIVNLEDNNDTKLIWYPQGTAYLFQPGKLFEIQIGDSNPSVPPIPYSQELFKDTFGNTLPVTYIDFSVDKCQPIASLMVTDNNVRTVVCSSGLFDVYTSESGYAVKLTAGISNPSCGVALTVEGKVWLELPDGSLLSFFDPFTTVQLSPGDNFSVDLLNYTFVGSEPLGNYKFGFRLLNPVTGDNYSTGTTSFSFGVCPLIF